MTKKNIKSILALFLAAATLFAITGCSTGTGGVAGDKGDTVTAAVDTDAAAVTDNDGTAIVGDDTGTATFDLSNIDVGDEILIPELLPVGEITPAADEEILLMADGDIALTPAAATINTTVTVANDKPWINGGGWGNTNGNGDDNGNDGHVPGTPRDSKPMRSIPKAYYYNLVTLVKSVSNPTKAVSTNVNDTTYGKVNWSTAAQGYISFTAKGQTREFILQGPNGNAALFDVQKDETIKVSIIDGTGTYQYAIANKGANNTYSVQYKNSFSVNKIDTDLAPYLVSNPYGDYDNAPNAVAKADELWDTGKTQLDNVKAIAKWVGKLKYDKSLKTGPLNIYVDPDQVIENGGGVCNDMAKLLVAMLRSQGVPAYYQYGKNSGGGAHAWAVAWVEVSTETKNGTTYSTGTWITIEATSGSLQTKDQAKNNYTPDNYAN